MNDTKSLAGTWSCLSAIVDGKDLPAETVKALRLHLTEERYKTTKGGTVLFDSTYQVDAAKNPREINMIGTEGDLAGKIAQGIYRVEGAKLTICYRMPGLGRPEKFESPSGSQNFLVMWGKE